MASWDELFQNPDNIARCPQPEVHAFIRRLESAFPERPLRIWDVCCGGGRHTILAARMGHAAYGSDISPTGIGNLRQWASERGVTCRTAVADMTRNPWEPGERFHGLVSWDALHHNTLGNMRDAAAMLREALVPGGLFILTLISTLSGGHEKGSEIEPGTFVEDEGYEAGVPHHYFDRAGIHALFADWRILILAEVEVRYVETEPDFWKRNPFPYTKWNLLLQKP